MDIRGPQLRGPQLRGPMLRGPILIYVCCGSMLFLNSDFVRSTNTINI